MKRRNFLKNITCFIGSTLLTKPSFATAYNEQLSQKAQLHMGTYVNISLIHENNDLKNLAFEKTFHEIIRLENILTYQKDSPLSQLNSIGNISQPPEELFELIEISLLISQKTQNAFNPWILPAMEVMEQEKVLSFLELPISIQNDLIKICDSKQVSLFPNKICYSTNTMKGSLCGIAKGYIIEKASKVLLNLGIENFLIDAGGDVYAHGAYSLQEPWKVGVINSFTQEVHAIALYNAALATSSNIFSNHIVNTSVTNLSSASILHASPCIADALATASMATSTTNALGFVNEKKTPALFQSLDFFIHNTLI